MFLSFILIWLTVREGEGERQGVEHLEEVSSHWSSCLISSCGVGPPSPVVLSCLWKNSSPVLRSHICIAPLLWPVNQSEISIDMLQPIRDQYCYASTNQRSSSLLINQSEMSIVIPVKMNLLGLAPILLLPSHSWTQKLVIMDPSTDLISHTLVPTEASLTVITSVSGITFWTNTCKQ